MKQYLLVFLNLFFINNSYTMETEIPKIMTMVDINQGVVDDVYQPFSDSDSETENTIATQSDGKIVVNIPTTRTNSNTLTLRARYNPNGTIDTTFDSDGKDSFSSFFTDEKLKKEANIILAKNNKFASDAKQKSNFILLAEIPIDILKKILFDYLVNTNSGITDEQEIYKDFRNLAQTCKFFSDLSKPIMAQIVLISDKQIELRLASRKYHIQEPDRYLKKELAPAAKSDIMVASKQNRALWLIKNYEKIKRNPAFDSRDNVEICVILATKHNCIAALKVLLSYTKRNKEIVKPEAVNRARKILIFLDGTPLYVAVKNLNINLVKLLLEDENYKKCVNIKNTSYGFLTPISCAAGILHDKLRSNDEQAGEKAVEIIRLLLQNGAEDLKNDSYVELKEFIPNVVSNFKNHKKFHTVLQEIEKLIAEFPEFFKDSKCEVM